MTRKLFAISIILLHLTSLIGFSVQRPVCFNQEVKTIQRNSCCADTYPKKYSNTDKTNSSKAEADYAPPEQQSCCKTKYHFTHNTNQPDFILIDSKTESEVIFNYLPIQFLINEVSVLSSKLDKFIAYTPYKPPLLYEDIPILISAFLI